MSLSFRECGRPVSDTDVMWLESELNMVVPACYKTFLRNANGGRPTPACFPIKGMQLNPYGVIQFFFGIDMEWECYDISWNARTLAGRIPDGLLPVACDNSGDIICLGVFGTYAEQVVFWDYYDEQPDPTKAGRNVYKVADSFSAFLNSISDEGTMEARFA